MPATASAQEAANARQGAGSAMPPRLVDLSALPQISAREIALAPQPLPPQTGLSPAQYAAKKALAARSLGSAPAGETATPAPAPSAKPGGGLLTPGITAGWESTGEAACGNVTPADQALAVGPVEPAVLQAINVCLDVYTKSGVLQAGYPKSLTSFVGLSPGTPTSDPRAMYDWINGRYILAFIQFDPRFASPSSYWIAVSQTNNPTGGYCAYNLGVQSVGASGGVFPLPDFPRLGQDRQAIYLASNIFNKGYKWEEILVLPKAQMYACQGFGFNFFSDLTLGGVATDTTQPANVSNIGDDPRSEYLVTSKNIFFGGGQCSNGCNGLVVWAINSPLSSPTITGTFVGTANTYSFPPGASQPGGANTIDSGDTRISGMAMYSGGSLYASLNTNGGSGQPGTVQYQIRPFINQANGQIASATIVNEIVNAGAFSWYYATQQPDPEGNVTQVFNFSGPNNYASLAYGSRRAAQPPGNYPDGGLFLANGQAFYNQGRWGDYTAVAPAGLISNVGAVNAFPTMWFAGMWAGSNGTWSTAIGKNGFTDISQP